MGEVSGVSEVGKEDHGEAIKLAARMNVGKEGGASDILQAVLNCATSSEVSTNATDEHGEDPDAAEDPDSPFAASAGRKFGWWNLLESATLHQSTEDFYASKTHTSAAQSWWRLERKAAKVGRGLSKDEKALKLGLQHWLEAIDYEHRYGHNLQFYYEKWIKSQTHEPFYYWLDVGEGRDMDLESCSRSKLQKQLVKYLSPKEREAYEVIIEDGKLLYKLIHQPVHTPKGDRWIFVMSPCGKFYVAKKQKGKFQHSSFLAGGVTTAAGRLVVNHGTLELMEAHSGHYLPTPDNFRALIATLTSSGADLTAAKVHLESEEEVRKGDAGRGLAAAPINNDNEMAFEALLASAGFSIRTENAHFPKSDSDNESHDSGVNDSGVDDTEGGGVLVLEVDKSKRKEGVNEGS